MPNEKDTLELEMVFNMTPLENGLTLVEIKDHKTYVKTDYILEMLGLSS